MTGSASRLAVALAVFASVLAAAGSAPAASPPQPDAASAHEASPDAEPVATLLDQPVDEAALGRPAGPRQLARRLAAWLILRTGEDYARREGLVAEASELAELRTYNAAFARHDRAQRGRKLTELDRRLGQAGLGHEERIRLERFRAVLARLAAYEADVDAGSEPAEVPDDATLSGLIVAWKVDAALYRRYGGSVGWSPIGPYAHGARAALVADYERRGWITYVDPGLAAEVREVLERPPLVRLPEAAVDFTPFWRRPLQPSYMGD